jgi:hypothetical protein
MTPIAVGGPGTTLLIPALDLVGTRVTDGSPVANSVRGMKNAQVSTS